MKSYYLFYIILIILVILFISVLFYVTHRNTFWSVRSIDTMKYSRDLSRQKLQDPRFDSVIDSQVSAIANTGATHVAIDTPYDPEFLPLLKRWVAAARKYNLHVWFRGNFSGWEQWFGYSKIDRKTHLEKTKEPFCLKQYRRPLIILYSVTRQRYH